MAASQNASAAVVNKPELTVLVAAATQFYCNKVNCNSRTWPNAKGRKSHGI